MKAFKTAIFYGFLVWVIPFVAAFLVFPLRVNERPLFESIMPVVVVAAVTVFAVKYFNRSDGGSFKEGVRIGLLWLAISIAIDLLMFMQGPMKMSLADYTKDIGITYLMIPIIIAGFGYILENKKKFD